jgi:hypothetical protein
MTNEEIKRREELKAQAEELKETEEVVNVVPEHSLSTEVKPTAVAVQRSAMGVGIQGMEDIPGSMIAVPFCRLVQPTSKKTELSDGKEAPAGSFFFNDIQESFESLSFVLLRAKHEQKKVDADGNFVRADYVGPTFFKPQVSILGVTTDTNKLFIISLSVKSFSSFGKLIAKFKSLQIDKTWRFQLKATSEKQENIKGKFYVVNFQLGEELSGEELAQMEETALQYGVALDREVVVEE